MKSAARNFSKGAKNLGQSIRTPGIVEAELEKSTRAYDRAFTVNTEAAYIYRYSDGLYPCSHLNWADTGGELFSEDDDFEAPVIIIEDDKEYEEGEDEEVLDEALEMLQETKDICPLCYGTGRVGSYKVANSFEIYFDTSYQKIIDKKGVAIENGKPFYFRPIDSKAYVVFRASLPMFFESMGRFTYISKDAREHRDLDLSLVKMGPSGGERTALSDIDLGDLLLTNPKVDIEFSIFEDIHAFFLRLLCGSDTIQVNFPNITAEIEAGEADYFSSITASVPSTEAISTKDVIKELYYNRYWKVTSVENKTGQRQDLGKDVGLRRVRAFERFALLP